MSGSFLRRDLVIVFWALGCSAGCASGDDSGPSGTQEKNRAVVREANGDYSFYAGNGIGEAIAHGEVIGPDYGAPFMSLRVPATLVDAAMTTPMRVTTVSFEVENPSIEATYYEPGQTRKFHPGDPWVTGHAQVGDDQGGFTMGFFKVIVWRRETGGIFTQEVFTTGLLPDDNLPILQYAGDPATWPPVPPTWQ